jgi:hypothetical protein
VPPEPAVGREPLVVPLESAVPAVLVVPAVAGAEGGAEGGTGSGAEGTAVDTARTPEAASVTGAVAVLTAPVAALTIGPAERGRSSVVAAWAWREARNSRRKIPAATIATCTARRAMRRDTCSVMVSSPTGKSRPQTCRLNRNRANGAGR